MRVKISYGINIEDLPNYAVLRLRKWEHRAWGRFNHNGWYDASTGHKSLFHSHDEAVKFVKNQEKLTSPEGCDTRYFICNLKEGVYDESWL